MIFSKKPNSKDIFINTNDINIRIKHKTKENENMGISIRFEINDNAA